MRTTNTFSVLFWLDQKNTKNNQGLLYVRINVNQKRVNISLKRKIDINLWQSQLKKAKGNSAQAKSINQHLLKVNAKLFDIYQDLIYKNELITAQLIKAIYLGEDQNHKTLTELISYHAEKIKNTLAPGTIRNFQITENYISKFLSKQHKTSDIYLHQLDYKFICDFQNFLVNYRPKVHSKAMKKNTVMKHLQRLRKIVTIAYHMEWIEKDPFIRWKPEYEKTNIQFLSNNELSNIESFEFPTDRLSRVRDLFVFSCYTGISYIDIMQLTKENIHLGIDGNNWIITKRQKTKSDVRVPLLDTASQLIQKYENYHEHSGETNLFPIITNEKLNCYLKEVAFYCGIKKNLTFHMARHTFATTVTLTNGVPIETVSKMLGHSKIATTQIYAKVIETKVSEDMNQLRNILNNKRNQNEPNDNANIC